MTWRDFCFTHDGPVSGRRRDVLGDTAKLGVCDDAVVLDEIDRAGADARLAAAREALDDATDDRAKAEAEKAVTVAEALVAAVAA